MRAVRNPHKSSLSRWHAHFYKSGRKIVPPNISSPLSPLAVAVWFMDDGAADYAGVTFQTHNFRRAEVDLLAEALEDQFQLATNVRGNRGCWIVYVKAVSLPLMREILEPHLLPDFKYKLVPRRLRTP